MAAIKLPEGFKITKETIKSGLFGDTFHYSYMKGDKITFTSVETNVGPVEPEWIGFEVSEEVVMKTISKFPEEIQEMLNTVIDIIYKSGYVGKIATSQKDVVNFAFVNNDTNRMIKVHNFT